MDSWAPDGAHSEHVIVVGRPSAWAQDLPLCFPSRACVDVPPLGAQALYLVSDITAASPAIAAALWAGLGIALVLIGRGLRQHWRGLGLRPWLVLLAVALVVGGAVLAWTMNGWLGEAGLICGGSDGRPAAPVPSTIVGSWPLVQAAARSAMALGGIALFLMLNTTVLRQRRAARAHETPLGQPR